MINIHKRKWLDLQRHADGGGAAGGDAGGATVGTAAADGQSAGNSGGTEPVAAAQNPRPSFDEILKDPEYSAAYKQRVESMMNRRWAKAQADEKRLQDAERLFATIGDKYGAKPGDDGRYDIAALQKSINDDTSFFEEAAARRGCTVEDYKHIMQLEHDNAEFSRREKEAAAQRNQQQMYSQLMQGAAETKAVYKDFDLDTELKNPTFARMVLNAGVPVRSAFEVVHKDQIMPAAMQYTAKRTAQAAAQTVAAGKARPAENGASASQAVNTDLDPAAAAKDPNVYRRLVEEARRGIKHSF